jgi:hypothetical protein
MTSPNQGHGAGGTPPPQGYQKTEYAGDTYQQADAQSGGAGWMAPVLDVVHRVQAGSQVNAQAASLQQGQDLRAAPSTGGNYYMGYSHERLAGMVADVDAGAVGEIGRAYNDIGNTLVELAADMSTAITMSEHGWTGNAGNSARGYMTGLSQWIGQTGQGSQLAGNRMGELSQSVETAKNSMPEPNGFNQADALKHNTSFTGLLNPIDIPAEAAKQQEAHQEAAQVVQTYDSGMGTLGSTMPAFSEPPAFTSGGGGTGHQPGYVYTPPGGTGGFQPPVPPGGSGNPGSGNTPSGSGNPGTVAPPPGPRPGTVPTGPLGTVNQAYATPVAPPQSGFGPYGTPPGGPSTGGGPGMFGVPGGSGFGPGGGGGSGGGAGSGGRGGGAGGRPGGVPGAGGESGRGGAGGPRGGMDGHGPMGGGRGGAQGGAGRPGAGGMGRGGQGGGDEDYEHQRPSYLVERDPESIFGTDERTAPPVIGL